MAYRNKFLDMKNLPTCIAPWHALTIKWGGNVVPDIIYKDKLGNINDSHPKRDMGMAQTIVHYVRVIAIDKFHLVVPTVQRRKKVDVADVCISGIN